jgi:hypothetical protein
MYGICILPIIPLRSLDSDVSEMVSQVLFGERISVEKNKSGCTIQTEKMAKRVY